MGISDIAMTELHEMNVNHPSHHLLESTTNATNDGSFDTNTTSSTDSNIDFFPTVFWAINFFLVFLILLSCTACSYRYHDAPPSQHGDSPSQQESSEQYKKQVETCLEQSQVVKVRSIPTFTCLQTNGSIYLSISHCSLSTS